jgi:spore coat polysaccharide biosynthesis protein SpsF
MPPAYSTPQEVFWAGEFGTAYIDRNKSAALVAANTANFARILSRTSHIRSVMEFGANIGLNLIALRRLLPEAELYAVEINADAVEKLGALAGVRVYHTSILDFTPTTTWDLVLSKGLLIHIDSEKIDRAYECLYKSSSRYICIAEYYNPTPVSIPYRGHADRLFKRDFAGDLIERYPDLRLVAYEFVYHRDGMYPWDDVTWFLLEKDGASSIAGR